MSCMLTEWSGPEILSAPNIRQHASPRRHALQGPVARGCPLGTCRSLIGQWSALRHGTSAGRRLLQSWCVFFSTGQKACPSADMLRDLTGWSQTAMGKAMQHLCESLCHGRRADMLRPCPGLLWTRCYAVELFCGHKAVTNALQEVGLEAVGIDLEDWVRLP
jgi:hypothetical protein